VIWPFDIGGVVLALYVVTFALHAVFVSYVLAGTAYVLVRRDDHATKIVRDRLPFMLGCGITAGVAPLLFTQLLYQRRFYTANLLLGPRWLAIVPALVIGFYALYLAKSKPRWRTRALVAALGCFAFVAWSWTELHQLGMADTAWREFYAAGHRIFIDGDIAPRLVVWFGAMATLFATVAAWSADAHRLAIVAIAGRVVSTAGAGWLASRGFTADGPAAAWLVVLASAVAVELGGWLLVLRDRPIGLALATGGCTAALLAACVVREAPRLAMIVPAPEASGGIVFAITLVVATAAISWVVKTVRSADPE
jgi:hypothetical protein